MPYNGYTQARNIASQKYNKKTYEQLAIRIQKGKREEYKQLAERKGESLAGLIVRLLEEELKKEKAPD